MTSDLAGDSESYEERSHSCWVLHVSSVWHSIFLTTFFFFHLYLQSQVFRIWQSATTFPRAFLPSSIGCFYITMYSFARRIGNLLNDDFQVELNDSAAASLFQMCIAEQYHTGAMFDYANMIMAEVEKLEEMNRMTINPLIPPNQSIAIGLYQDSAILGDNCHAMVKIADIMAEESSENMGSKASVALRWYEMHLQCCDRHNHPRDAIIGCEIANILASGTPYVRKDIPRAIALYEEYHQSACNPQNEWDDVPMKIVQLYLTRQRDVDRNVPQALQICRDFFNRFPDPQHCVPTHIYSAATKVHELAKLVAHGSSRIQKDAHLATQILEMRIETKKDQYCIAVLFEILLTQAPDGYKSVDRAIQLCNMYLDEEDCRHELTNSVVQIARKIMNDDHPIAVQNTILPVYLLEMCIKKRNDWNAIVTLVDVFRNGTSGVGKDAGRALNVCERVLEKNPDMVANMVNLSKQMIANAESENRNVCFAVELLRLCIEKTDSPLAVMLLVRTLMMLRPQSSEKLKLALHLSEDALEKVSGHQFAHSLVEFANEILTGSTCAQSTNSMNGLAIAVTLLQLCIMYTRHEDAIIRYVHILATGGLQNMMNDTQALKLCKTYVHEMSKDEHFVHGIVDVAEKKWKAEVSTPEDVMFALRLLEICFHERKDGRTLSALVELLVSGVPGIVRNTTQAIHLLRRYLMQSTEILKLISRISFGTPKVVQDTLLGAYLCEVFIEKFDNPIAKLILAEILVAGAPGVKRDTARAIELCKQYIVWKSPHPIDQETRSIWNLGRLALKICRGECGIKKDVKLAIELGVMCVRLGHQRSSRIVLAEILLCETMNRVRNKQRAFELCRFYLARGRNISSDDIKIVEALAEKIARGWQLVRDVQFAIELYGLCMEEERIRGSRDIVRPPGSWKMYPVLETLTCGLNGAEKNIPMAIYLCETQIETACHWNEVFELAKKLTYGTDGIAADRDAAMPMWDLCVNRGRHRGAILHLARVLIFDTPGTDNTGLVMNLCEQYIMESVMQNQSLEELVELAWRIWDGVLGVRGDLALAMDICGLCIEMVRAGEAMVALAEMLLSGVEGVERDVERAIGLCEESLLEGCGCCGVEDVAIHLERGSASVVKDVRLAVLLYELCVEKGSCRAMYFLAGILNNGGDGVDADRYRASQLYVCAVDGGFDGQWECEENAGGVFV